MDWLTNWDDLIHGTAVFGATLPFTIGFLVAWKLPRRYWWLAVTAAVVGSFLWLFGLPTFPPRSSEAVALTGLGAALVSLAPLLAGRPVWSPVLGLAIFTALGWSIYPAWLQESGGWTRHLIVSLGLSTSTIGFATLVEGAHREKQDGPTCRLSLASLIPPSIALAVLLQLGGSARFGQAIGAVAAALAALLIWILRRPNDDRPKGVTALWGALFMLLAWSGWLFAEIRYGLAALLLLAPIASLLVNLLPLPRRHPLLDALWDGFASALVSALVAGIAISQYLEEMSEFEGY